MKRSLSRIGHLALALASTFAAVEARAQEPAAPPPTATFAPVDETPPSAEATPPRAEPAPATKPQAAQVPAARSEPQRWDYVASESSARPKRQGEAPPLAGFGVGSGLTFGGEALITAVFADGGSEELTAGGGVEVLARAFVVPLWLGDTLGFGASVDFGWKHNAIDASNATVTLDRYPLDLMARGLLHASSGLNLLFAGGIHYEFGVSLAGSGDVQGQADLDNALGATGEAGLLYAKDHLGLDLTIRHTWLDYTRAAASADASHTGVFTGIFYTL